MSNYELQADEVVLYEGFVSSNIAKGTLQLTLTSKKLVFDKEKGVFKKEREVIDVIPFEEIKFYNDAAQIKQKGSEVTVQTIKETVTLSFDGMLEARKFTGKIIDAITGTTLAQRSSNKIKGAIDMVDNTLGVDTRSTIKGVMENGIKGALFKGALFNGIGKKK